jgi:hypothetical protein
VGGWAALLSVLDPWSNLWWCFLKLFR